MSCLPEATFYYFRNGMAMKKRGGKIEQLIDLIPRRELNAGSGGESAESYPLDHVREAMRKPVLLRGLFPFLKWCPSFRPRPLKLQLIKYSANTFPSTDTFSSTIEKVFRNCCVTGGCMYILGLLTSKSLIMLQL